jgi:hypothetical protein
MSDQIEQSSLAVIWRTALLLLAITLGLTNLVELASTARPGYWDQVGLIGLGGTIESDKLQVSEAARDRNRVVRFAGQNPAGGLPALAPGDLVSVVSRSDSRAFRLTPLALEFFRFRERSEILQLRIERGSSFQLVSAGHRTPVDTAGLVNYYGQVGVDLIFAIVGGLLAWRRPDDKAIRALSFAMICWSSIIPATSDSPIYDVLFFVNQFTARVWVEILLVYWAIHFSPASRWGISRRLQMLWPAWAMLTVLLGFMLRIAAYRAFPVRVDTLQRMADYNQTVVFIVSLAALGEGILSTQGETRTRIRWALCVFGLYFFLFPFRIYIEPLLDLFWPGQLPSVVVDTLLQLALPLGLLYATLRHRLLDLSFAINRGLVYGAFSLIVLAAFFGLEKLSDSVLQSEGREQHELLAGCIAFTIFLIFHKIRDWVEGNVERLFFSSWHRKEAVLREYVRSAAHITRIEALIGSCVDAIDKFTDRGGCAIYRHDANGDYLYLSGSAADAATTFDGNAPIVLAMRVGRRALKCADVDSTLRADWALPIFYRGEIDGFVLLNRKLSQEAYRPDEIEVLNFAVQQIGMDLTALEREQYKQQAHDLASQASTARSSAEEMRKLLQLALGRQLVASENSTMSANENGGS